MHRIDGPGATVDNKFTKGNPAAGVPATTVTPEWLNAVQEELAYFIEQSGLELDPLKASQLFEALTRTSIQVISTMATMRGIPGSANRRLHLMGYYGDSDGAEGVFFWDAASEEADDNGTVIVPTGHVGPGRWKRLRYSEAVKAAWFGVKADGVTDGRAGAVSADSQGPFELSRGTTRISASVTFTNPVIFVPGANMTIDAGAVVTFSGGLVARDNAQIFYGAGSVSGLRQAFLAWFAGDKVNTLNNALSEIQKGYDAVDTSCPVLWPNGYLTIPGDTPIAVTKGQKTIGKGGFLSELWFSTAACNGFSCSTTIAPEIDGLSFVPADGTVIPTSGTLIKTTAPYTRLRNVFGRGGYIGFDFDGGVGCKATEFELLDCMRIGVHVRSTNDVFLDQFIIAATSDHLTLSGVAGVFVVGEVITGATSGAAATVQEVVSATRLKVFVDSKNFTVGEVITGGTSGATAIMSSQQTPHALGGLRLVEKTEAIVVSNGDIIGGVYSMTTDASSYALGVRPAYNKFSNVYFDSADQGVLLDKVVEFDFDTCWFSNRPNDGLRINQVENVRFTGGGAINNWKNGVSVSASAKGVIFTGGFSATGNSQEAANTHAGIAFDPGASDFIVQTCRLGGSLGFGTQRYGVIVNAGASDRYIVADNLVSGNGTAGVSDAGTGVNKRVANNY